MVGGSSKEEPTAGGRRRTGVGAHGVIVQDGAPEPDFPRGLQQLSDAIEEGFLRVNMLVSPGEVCSYGVEQESPRSTERQPVVAGRECTADVSGQQRGSAHVPAPLP